MGDLVRAMGAEGLDMPVYGVDDGCVSRDDGDLPYTTIAEAAEAAVAPTLEACIASAGGRVFLGGWSYGGVLAVELARLLKARSSTKVTVLGVVLFDAPLRGAVVDGPPEPKGLPAADGV